MKDSTDHIVDPTYDHRQQEGFEHGDERPCNWSANPTFYDVVEARFSRRGVLTGGLAAAVTGVYGASLFGAGAARAQETGTAALLGFEPVMISETDTIEVPAGYRAQVICRAGDPISGDMPDNHPVSSGADQANQIGHHHDGIHYFPIDGSSTDGYLVMNHEYIEPRYMHVAYEGRELGSGDVVYLPDELAASEDAADAPAEMQELTSVPGAAAEGAERSDVQATVEEVEPEAQYRDADEVLKELHAHGVSIVRVRRGEDGDWSIVEDPMNRRVHGLTEMEISAPVRGSDLVRTRFSPEGERTRGTLNNCAHGVTPWDTYLAAEENWAGYFTNGYTEEEAANQPREHSRYGVASNGTGRYGWNLAEGGADEYVRFDATPQADDATGDYRNEPNTFGWMVEIDPFDPESVPVKRTHLGRFAHEGVIFAPAQAGQPVVCYSGDDARFEYIYKFVSAGTFDPETTDGSILDEGTLYAARFNDDGSGEWLALVPGENGLTPENGFADLADILVNARLAADQAGATKMDRPEWGAVDPNSGEVYFTLTNNNRRIQAEVDLANPRAANEFGHIIRWMERAEDHTGTEFDWDLFVIAGGPDTSADLAGQALDETNIFACPDGLWIDYDSRVWIQTDIGESNQNIGDFEQFGNNAMLCANPETGEIRRFLTGPIGQEITGCIATPDQRTMFINVQHPGATTEAADYAAGSHLSHWPDGGGAWPRSATVVITKEDDGVVGT